MRVDWLPTGYEFAWGVVAEYKEWLWEGVQLTLEVAIVSMAFAMVLGLPIALMRMSPIWVVRSLASLYISIFRAIPPLVFILWMYYGVTVWNMGFLAGMKAFTAAVLGGVDLSLWSAGNRQGTEGGCPFDRTEQNTCVRQGDMAASLENHHPADGQ